jgi:hypothetical protein
MRHWQLLLLALSVFLITSCGTHPQVSNPTPSFIEVHHFPSQDTLVSRELAKSWEEHTFSNGETIAFQVINAKSS